MTTLNGKNKLDRQPRRKVTNSRHNSPVRHESRNDRNFSRISQVSEQIGKHNLSNNSTEEPPKKPRKETSLDSCHSEDMEACKKGNEPVDMEQADLGPS